MAEWIVPVSDLRFDEEDIAAVSDVYRSGWLTMGPRTEALEASFAAFTGVRHAVAVSSGTAALHLLALSAVPPGGEVVVPSLTFAASANAMRHARLPVRFADISGPQDPWLDPVAVEDVVGPETAAVLFVSYAGSAGTLPAVADLARRRGVTLIEDAAHALGATLGERHVGTLGVGGAYSFFSNKNLAVGEGGMLVTDDDEIAEQARLLRSHGVTRGTWDRHGRVTSYDVAAVGLNYRIDEARAALALRRLERLDGDNDRRRELDARYRTALTQVPGVVTVHQPEDAGLSACHLFPVLLDPERDRDAVRRAMAGDGVQTSMHYPALHQTAAYAGTSADLPRTEDYARRTLTLPLFPTLGDAGQDLVVAALSRALR